MAEMDPMELSRPINDDDWPQVQCAVSNLLQDLTHDKFVPLNATMWKKHGLSETLTQLTLVLLVGSGPADRDGNDLHHMSESLKQKWSIQQLNVLRDRVLMHRNDSRSLQDYLTLVQSLIAVDTAQEDPKAHVAHASMVGLASLSSICSQAKSLKEIPTIRKCILACCEDLSSLIERASVFQDPASAATAEITTTIPTRQAPPQWVSMIWAFLPLLEVLANIQADGTTLDTSRYYSPATDPQWLLNSGLFRALIMLYTKTAPYSSVSVAVDPARHQLLQCLQMLSLQNMSLLGKYAWRVPELNTLIHNNDYHCNNIVDGLVWSLMGQQLAGGTVVRLRTVTTITPEECAAMAVRQWCLLYQRVLGAIKRIEELRSQRQLRNSNDDMIDVGHDVDSKDWKHSILELSRFANCLASCDALPLLWREAMDQDTVREQLLCQQKGISDLPPPSPSPHRVASSSKTAENDKVGDPLERPDPSFEVEVGMVRKAMKVATMCLEQQCDDVSRRELASKTDRRVLSSDFSHLNCHVTLSY